MFLVASVVVLLAPLLRRRAYAARGGESRADCVKSCLTDRLTSAEKDGEDALESNPKKDRFLHFLQKRIDSCNLAGSAAGSAGKKKIKNIKKTINKVKNTLIS